MAWATGSPKAAPAEAPARARSGLRRRVAIAFLALSLTLIVVQTVGIYVVTEGQEDEFIDRILTGEMALVSAALDARAARAPLRPGVALYEAGAGTDRTPLPEALRALAEGLHEVVLDGREYHVLVRTHASRRLILTYDAEPHEQRIARFAAYLVGALLVSAALAFGLALWLSRLLSEQVTDLARRVAGLDPARAQAPLSGGYRDLEVATLAAAFDAYAARVAALLEREQAFTADASHELRTPLTALRTSCELLAEDPGLAPKSRERVARMGALTTRMSETVEALLFLAREIPLEQAEAVPLRALVEEVGAPLAGAPGAAALVIDIGVAATVRAWRPALRLVVDNLLRNAYAHTERGEVRVRFDGQRLSVADTGCGIAPEHLPHIFERRYRAAGAPGAGTGLGLAIVRRIADDHGWALAVDSAPGRGATFEVIFPLAG